MKLYNLSFSKLLSFMLLVLTTTSCQDDVVDIDELRAESNTNKVSTAEPTIAGVYDYDIFMASDTPSPCVEAEMGQYLIVCGENLEGLTSLLFHGIGIESSEYYAQWDMVVMSVPYELPASDASNVVVCTTGLGSAEYEIDLNAPDVEITGVNNEFQLPGRELNIIGTYLTLSTFSGGDSKIYLEKEADGYKEELVVSQVTDDAITITLPDSAPDNAYITFEIDGVAQSQQFHYRPTDLLTTIVPNEGTEKVTDAGTLYATIVEGYVEDDIDDIFGSAAVKYYRFKGDIPASTALTVFYVTSTFDLPADKEASDFELVYEMNTKVDCAIPTGTTYKFMVNDSGVNMWDGYSNVEVDTNGEWITQRIDFAEVSSRLTAVDDKHKFNIKAVGAVTNADHAFANFRIEPIIK